MHTAPPLALVLGPLLRIANFLDSGHIRVAFIAFVVVGCVLLGPLAALLVLATGRREPELLAIGLGGLNGLVGASVRMLLR